MCEKQLLAITVMADRLCSRDETFDPKIPELLKDFKGVEFKYGQPHVAMCIAAPAADVEKISAALKDICVVEDFKPLDFGFDPPMGLNIA